MRRIQFFLLFLLQASMLSGQELPAKCEVFLPKVILENTVLKESDVKSLLADPTYGQKQQRPSEKKYWIAYSDRQGNVTYTTPGGSTPHSVLSWNETLRIARISGKYALVYKEPNKKMTWPRISADAECKGWVRMDNLLLWDSCLADENGIYYKALVCRNVDAGSTEYGEAYRHPEDKSKRYPMDGSMRFYFVMKRHSNGNVLLATQYTMTGDSEKVLYAWLPESSYIPWNQRSCIEPTWEEEDVEYLAAKGAKAVFYDQNGQFATSFTFRTNNEPYSEYKYRMNPNVLRFPILDMTTEKKYDCSSFTSQDLNADPDKERREQLEKLKKINLAIVIDGTISMERYFPAVYKAIQEGCEYFDDAKYKIKVGVVIYRDYGDGEQGLCEIFPYTRPNDPKLFEFLSTGGKYGIKSSKDKTLTEALFYGMNEALDKLKADPEESSLMLVIGDCGNALNDTKGPTQAMVEKKIVAQNVNVVGYQVRNVDSEAFNLFNRQMLQIVKNTLQTKYDNLVKGTRVKGKIARDGQDFYNDVQPDALYIGAHKYATRGSTISPDVLTSLMKGSMMRYSELVQHHLDIIVNPDYDVTPIERSEEVAEATGFAVNREWLRKRVPNAGGELLGFRGWTDKKHSSGINYYKPILFISSEEFTELLLRLEPVYRVSLNSDSNERRPYIDAIKQLLKSFNPGLTNAQLESMGIADITTMIQGLNEASESMTSERTLIDIASPKVVKAPEYRKIVTEFARKYENLRAIKDNRYEYVRVFNGAKYYWIPIEDLP